MTAKETIDAFLYIHKVENMDIVNNVRERLPISNLLFNQFLNNLMVKAQFHFHLRCEEVKKN